MIESNATGIIYQINYSSIIGPVIGGSLAAIAGILLSKYNNEKAKKERQRIVARAFFEEISSHLDAFNLLLEDYNTTSFDEAFNDLDDKSHINEFQNLAIHLIVTLEIATWGPYATFLQEKNPFTVFFEDIYKFDDIQTTRNLLQLYRYLVSADKHYHNYCHDQNHPVTDLRKFLEAIENAVNLINDWSMLDDLRKKSQI